MEPRILEIAQRIKALREIMDIPTEEMAAVIGIPASEYLEYEKGTQDFSFTFLYKCADRFSVDMVELLTGENPRLSFYTVVRKGTGLPIKRRSGFSYFHLGAHFKDKLCEPFLVKAPYKSEEQDAPIALSTHEGQELDYILSGSLKIVLDGHTEILRAGDSVYYDSSHPHGMIAIDNADCEFLALILKKPE